MGHSYGTLLSDTLVDTLVGHSCGTLLWDTHTGHSCGTLGHSCRKLLWGTLVGHSSYETSSKSHASSLKNERFVRGFLQNSHVKVCQTRISYETSSKSPAAAAIRAYTSCNPAKQFRDSSPSKRHPLKRQSQCDSDIHLYHNSQPPDSLHRPRIFPRPHV